MPQKQQDMTPALKESIEYQNLQTQMNQMFEDAKSAGFWIPIPPNRVSDEFKAAKKEWNFADSLEKAKAVYEKYRVAFEKKLSETAKLSNETVVIDDNKVPF